MFVLGLGARFAYVEIVDRRAVAAAGARCTQSEVLQIHQPRVWNAYLRRSPAPSCPPDPPEVQQRRFVEQHELRMVLGLRVESVGIDDDNVLIMYNANGEVARLRFVSALSAAYSIEGPRTQIFDCYGRHREYYRYSYLFA